MQGVYIQSVSGYTALVNSSGALNVNASVTATANISGQAVFLGSGSFAPLSGLYVNISGQGVTATATANISGQAVFLGSGSVLGLSGLSVSFFSGSNNVREVGTSIVNSALSGANIITGNSGGNTLFSGGPLLSVIVRSASGNSVIYIGQPSQVSNGIGMPLYANESMTLKVSNFNAIGAFALTSGQLLSYIGLL